MKRSPTFARRVAWRVSRSFGGRLATWAWNDQFRRGRWLESGEARSAITIGLVTERAAGGRVVELGCADGSLPAQMPAQSFSSYHGVDISDVAVVRARARGLPNCTFATSRLEDWPGDANVNVLVAEEVLYYLAPADRRSLLARCLRSLSPTGTVLAVVHDAYRHADTLDDVRAAGIVQYDRLIGSRGFILIGLAPALSDEHVPTRGHAGPAAAG